jgi:DNA-3-methyladenine glycosylase
VLPRRFYERDALRLGRALLGKVLVRGDGDGVCAARIVEVEAYRGPGDRAAHSAGGRRTPRNEVMWGPAGRLYVYFVYGMHWCANIVAARDGVPEAVLIRAAEPVAGLERMRARRPKVRREEDLLRGPACLCRALCIDGALNGLDLADPAADERGELVLRDAPAVRAERVVRSPRIGIAYAGEDAALPWRLYVAGSRAVSGRRG